MGPGDRPESAAGGGPSGGPATHDGLAQESRETRLEVAVAVAVVVAMQLLLAWLSLRNEWFLFGVHGWIWWIPVPLELLLLGLLVLDRNAGLDPAGERRRFGIALLAGTHFDQLLLQARS